MSMKNHILVAYATKYGTTRDIAARIATILSEAGFSVQLQAADKVTRLSGYDAVVLGSSVYFDNWLADAEVLVDNCRDGLTNKAIWLFSVGLTPELIGKAKLNNWLPVRVRSLIDALQLQDAVCFAGKVDASITDSSDWLANSDLRDIHDDYRNWEVIESWASDIGKQLGVLKEA